MGGNVGNEALKIGAFLIIPEAINKPKQLTRNMIHSYHHAGGLIRLTDVATRKPLYVARYVNSYLSNDRAFI